MKKIFNTGETAEQLKATYNPDGSTLRAVQERLLDMLLYLDKVCKTINVPYRLDGGNVLGALRHDGFIPWDDDLDVAIEEKHYKRLCDYLKTHPHPRYVLQSTETDKGSLRFWCTIRDTKSEYIHRRPISLNDAFKYRGLQIDLFSMHRKQIPFLHRAADIFYRYTVMKIIGHSFFLAKLCFDIQRYIIHPVFYFISRIFGNSNMYMFAYGTPFKYRFPKDVVLPYKNMNYEGHAFPGPANPEEYCAIHYGPNYGDLPDKDHRNHHDVVYVLTD